MTSTSSEHVVLRGLPDESVAGARGAGDLRTGGWTRLGDAAVLGDAATEATLTSLADRARAAARAEGYASGWAEGRRRAMEATREAEAALAATLAEQRVALAEQQSSLLQALTTAAESCGSEFRSRYVELADQALELALQIAEAVLDREVELAREPGLDALRRALADVDPATPVTVRLHPADVTTLHSEALAGREVRVVGDPTVARGDAVAETDVAVVDATIADALRRVREVLGR